eukprot:COSAG04_NODE_3367_length_2882_cov_1.729429_4_plen_93_part_00
MQQRWQRSGGLCVAHAWHAEDDATLEEECDILHLHRRQLRVVHLHDRTCVTPRWSPQSLEVIDATQIVEIIRRSERQEGIMSGLSSKQRSAG